MGRGRLAAAIAVSLGERRAARVSAVIASSWLSATTTPGERVQLHRAAAR